MVHSSTFFLPVIELDKSCLHNTQSCFLAFKVQDFVLNKTRKLFSFACLLLTKEISLKEIFLLGFALKKFFFNAFVVMAVKNDCHQTELMFSETDLEFFWLCYIPVPSLLSCYITYLPVFADSFFSLFFKISVWKDFNLPCAILRTASEALEICCHFCIIQCLDNRLASSDMFQSISRSAD